MAWRPNWRAIAEGAIIPLVLLLLWQAASASGFVDPRKIPSPIAVATRWITYIAPEKAFDPAEGSWFMWLWSGEFLRDAAGSLWRVLMGFIIGGGLALPLGLLMGTSKLANRLLNPLFQLLRPIPPIAYIPLAMLWFGLGNPPAIFLITLGAFFPVLINTVAGVKSVDSIYMRAARNLGASELTIFRRVILPAAAPHILSGMRIAIGTAFIVVIVAEMIAVNNGLGYRILEAREFFWTDKVIAGMLSIGFIGLAIDGAVEALNARLLRWHRGADAQ